MPSHSPKPANSAARGGSNTDTQLSEGIAGNTIQGAERLGARSESLAHVGSSALSALTIPSPSEDVRSGIAVRTATGETITIEDLSLKEIHVGPRHRQDMGDLQALADSMREHGLLQPIGVTAGFTLVFGARRLRAAQILGWDTIAARIVDVPSIVIGEYAENEVRKDFTPSERVTIAEVSRLHIGERRGRPGREKVDSSPQFSGKTRDLLAGKTGFSSGKEYERARSVVERGAPSVVAAMDGGEVSISAAARAVKAAPKEQQTRWTVADIRRAAKEAAIGPDSLPTPRQARERSRQTGALVLASDGKYHAFTTAEQDKAADAYHTLRFALLQDIPPLDPADAVASVPEHMRSWVAVRAAERLAWFERFITLWRQHHAA